MLIRILGEGQYVVPDTELDEINRLDSALEAALSTAVDDVRPALDALLEKVRSVGVRPPEDSLEESGVILPFADSSEEDIRAMLNEALQPTVLELVDESALHAGHAGAASGGGHYRLRIVSSKFEGLKLVMRHRLVYDAVHTMMHSEIHALAITALAPSEV